MSIKWITRTLRCSLCALFFANFAFAQDKTTLSSPQENADTKQSPSSDVTTLPEMTVAAPPVDEKAYNAPNATTATKTDTPIRDVPQAIEVRPRQVLDDISGQQRVDSVAKTVAGVTIARTGNGGSNIPFLTLRGFPNNGIVLRDGYYRPQYTYAMDAANIERVEFLKGPASALYGLSGSAGNNQSLGGAVNYISKRPLASPHLETQFTAGAFSFYRGTVDMGGALTTDNTLLFRLNGAYEDSRSFRDFAAHTTEFIAPALTFQPTPDDTVTILTDYLHLRNRTDLWLPLSPLAFRIPIRRYFGDPNFDHTDTNALNVNITYDHTFNEAWRLHFGYSLGRTVSRSNYTYPLITDPVEAPQQVARPVAKEHFRTTSYDGELQLLGKFRTGPLAHQLLFGLSTALVYDDGPVQRYDATLPSVNIFERPTYGIKPVGFSAPASTYTHPITTIAPYIQDLITLTPQLKLLLGARYDWIQQYAVFGDGLGNKFHDTVTDTKPTPRVGLVFQPWWATSAYFGYATSFNPSFGRTRQGQTFKPEEGEQFEFGIKQELNDSLNVNFALYQLTRQNVLTTDPSDPLFSIQTGEQRSRGLELDVNGSIGNALRLTLSYAFMKAKITKDNVLPVGAELVNAPRHAFNLFGVYSFSGVLNGVEAGAGVYYAGKTQAQSPNTFLIPEVIQVDAMLAYQFNQHIHWQLNFENLTDRHNYSSDGGFITPLTPFSVIGSMRYTF